MFGFGVALRRADKKSGTLKSLTWCQAAWCDFENSVNRKSSQKVHELLQFPHPPSVIVDSGGGLHAYWRLARPLDMWDQVQQTHIREVCHGMARTFGSDPNVHDPARLLRVPGTFNQGERQGQGLRPAPRSENPPSG